MSCIAFARGCVLPRLPCQIKAPTRSRLNQTGASGALICPGTVRLGFFVRLWVHGASSWVLGACGGTGGWVPGVQSRCDPGAIQRDPGGFMRSWPVLRGQNLGNCAIQPGEVVAFYNIKREHHTNPGRKSANCLEFYPALLPSFFYYCWSPHPP